MSLRSHTIRVVSYNIRALKDSRDAVIDVVHALNPDVLLLQEVPRHPFSGHRIAALADEFGLTWSAGSRGRMSTTLMTSLRLDVLAMSHHNLPVQQWDEPRGYAIAQVRLPGHGPLTAISTHLSLRPAERPVHAQALLDAAGDYHQPMVIGGDVNEKPGNPGWRVLSDALNEVSADEPTYPSSGPVRRIDGIFASSSLAANVPVIELDRRDLADATDHCPIWVDLDLTSLSVAGRETGQ